MTLAVLPNISPAFWKASLVSYMIWNASPGSMNDTGCLGLAHWDDSEGWYGEGGGRREEGSTWGTLVCLWRIHVDIWQNQYNTAKLKNKIKKKRKASLVFFSWSEPPWGYDFCDEPQMWCVLLITSGDLWYQCDDLTTGEIECDHLVKVGCLRFPYCNITVLPLSPLYSL